MAWKALAQRIQRFKQVDCIDFSMMTEDPGYEVIFWSDLRTDELATHWRFDTAEKAINKFEQITAEHFT